jgi:hypothetical protein
MKVHQLAGPSLCLGFSSENSFGIDETKRQEHQCLAHAERISLAFFLKLWEQGA